MGSSKPTLQAYGLAVLHSPCRKCLHKKNCSNFVREIAVKNAAKLHRTYVVIIYKNIFKDFCVRNTVRYKEVAGMAMFWHKIKARCLLGEFSAWNTLLHSCISLACQLPKNNDKCSPLSAEFAKNCMPWQKLWQFAGHGQNCKLAAKHENRRKIADCKIAIFCKD